MSSATKATAGVGSLAVLMQRFFRENYGQTTLPKTVADYAIYDQLALLPGITQFFQGQFTPARSNWPNGNNFICAESEHMVVQSIKAYEAFDNNAITEADWSAGISDPICKGGSFDVTINGQRVLTQVPFTVFDYSFAAAVPGSAGATNEDRGRFYLMEPLVVLGQTSIQINAILPAGSTPTEDYKVRLELEGQRFIGN